ncbi:MAG: hypothetical protein QXQ53_05785 [Candidatus Methanosuratincola sp.]
MQLWWDSFTVLKETYEVPDADFKKRIEEPIELLQLSDEVYTQVRKLRLGERMKSELAVALLHEPKSLFLDEPTIGLDVVSQKRIRDFLKYHNKHHNTIILLLSHYMQDVAQLCERVIVIDNGSVIFDGSPSELTRMFNPARRLHLVGRDEVTVELSRYGKVISRGEKEVMLQVPRERTSQVAALALSELPVGDIAIKEVDIEDVIRGLFTRGHESIAGS